MTPPGITAATEKAILDTYNGYVAPGHEAVSAALVAAMREPSHQSVGHALIRRIVGEMFTTLESFGSWLHALRHRGTEAPGLLNALMRCRTDQAVTALDDFIACADPFEFLQLPAPADFIERLDDHLAEHGLTANDVTEGLDEIRSWSQDVVTMRALDSGKMLTLYNKGRHGLPFALVEGDSPWEMRLADNDAEGGLRVHTFNQEMIETIHHNTKVLGNRVGSLVAYTMLLNDLDLLYPNETDEEE